MTTSDKMVKPSHSFYALLAVAVGTSCAVPYALWSGSADRCAAIASTLAAVGATILGFVLTAVTILAALAKTQLVENMYRTGHAKLLLDELFAAVIVYLLVTTCAILCLVGPASWASRTVILAVSYFVLGVAVLAFAGHKFYAVMLTLGPAQTTSAR